MRTLLVAALLATSAPAFAQDAPAPPEGTATPAATGSEPAEVASHAIDADYTDSPPCGDKGCDTKVVKKLKVKAGEVQVRHYAGEDAQDMFVVVIGESDGEHYFAADAVSIPSEDCGAGNCIETDFSKAAAKQVGDIVWVTITAKARHEFIGGKADHWHKFQVVVACRADDHPACAEIDAGDSSGAGSAKIKGSSVVVKDEQGTRTITVSFP